MAGTDHTADSLARVIRREMAEQDLRFREFAERMDLSHGYISALANERDRPSEKTIKRLADGFGIAPSEILEYRLAQARRLFDEREKEGVGLEQAAANLATLEEAGLFDVSEDPADAAVRAADEAVEEIEERVREAARPRSADEAGPSEPASSEEDGRSSGEGAA